MGKVKCSYCGSYDVEFHEYYGTYTCNGCNTILGDDEVINESEDTSNETLEQGDDLSALSMFLFTLLMFIPLVDFLIVFCINKSSTKWCYKRLFSYRLIGSLLLYCGLFLVLATSLNDMKHIVREKTHNFIFSTVSSVYVGDSQVSNLLVPSGKDYLSAIADKTEHVDDSNEHVPSWRYLDGTIVTGDYALRLISEFERDTSILIQTKLVADKYNEDTYMNIGIMVNGAEKHGSTSAYFYEGTLSEGYEPYTNDYGDFVSIASDDIYNKRYIYYVNGKSHFMVRLVSDETGNVLAFSMQEVEIKQ